MPQRPPTYRPPGAERARRAATKAHDVYRGSAASRGYDSRWSKVRDMQLTWHPLCEDCWKRGITRTASEVHHIVSIKERPDLRLRMDNLMSLCHACHQRIESA